MSTTVHVYCPHCDRPVTVNVEALQGGGEIVSAKPGPSVITSGGQTKQYGPRPRISTAKPSKSG